ncbi:hypothetical protein UlMin_028674 [Ulmus minor]
MEIVVTFSMMFITSFVATDTRAVWNHDFFWESMKPDGGGNSSGELLELIERDFVSFDKFIAEFKSPAATQFDSCWAWLVCDLFYVLIQIKRNRLDVENAVNPNPSEQDKKLAIVKSPNVINPLVWDIFASIFSTETFLPLLTIDVRETGVVCSLFFFGIYHHHYLIIFLGVQLRYGVPFSSVRCVLPGYQDIIDKHNHERIQISLKYAIHQVHEGS